MSSSGGDDDVDLALTAEEFDAFYAALGPSLWGYLLRASGDRALASDVMQEALLRFLRGAPAGLEPGRRRAYLFRIASNLLHDAWRLRRREVPFEEETLDEPSDEGVAHHRDELAHDLERAFLVLRPIERELVWLAHVEGFPHRELAEVLGLEEGSIKVMLFRARKKLAAHLGPPEGMERGERR